jgi:hypothetical protein
MIDWIRTVQGIGAIVAAIFATMVAWRNLPAAPRVLARGADSHPD